jgi:hypothetical protein
MSPSPQSAAAAPLPPLPPPQSAGSPQPQDGQGGSMQALLSGIAPVKMGVDQILMACKQIVQSGAIPGAEQLCGQIVALATSLLPMAAQQMMQPGGGGPPAGGPPGGGIPPVGGPPPGPMVGQ